MSGAEAGLIIGLIADSIAISGMIIDLYRTVKNPDELPQAFRAVAQKLPVAKDILEIAHKEMEGQTPDDNSLAAIKPTVEACTARISRLESIVQEILPKLDTWRLVYYTLMRKLGKGNEVEVLLKAILQDVQILSEHQVFKAATKDQVEKLTKAVEDIAKVPSSVPKTFFEGSSGNTTNVYSNDGIVGDYGQQTNNRNTGSGDFFTGAVTLHKEKRRDD
ncbi:SesA protein [Mariannaea sp. PMI_226]|nr:SesA protein [Mariannaea sp. PMI_226]